MLGWVCDLGFVYQFILRPFLEWYSLNHSLITPPSLDTGTLVTMILTLLGVAGLRTAEKFKGVDK